MKRILYITLAGLCVALAVAGMFLPILPTTPFLLLAIWLYMRSSKKGVKMILSNRLMAPYVYSYFSRKGIPKKNLIKFLLTLWLTLAAGMVLFHNNIHTIAILTAVGIGVSIHLYSKREKNN